MIAFAHDRTENANDRFIEMLPKIRHQAFLAFRSRDPETRAELIQEAVANAFVAYDRLVKLGKPDIAYPSPLAGYAIRQVLSGRRVGTKLNQRDVMSPANRRVTVEPLQRFDRHDAVWKEVLVEDRHAGPAETAAARIDIAKWFRKLRSRNRKIAKALALGESTLATAKKFGLSSGRVSQLRQELRQSWRSMQGELTVA